jgi:hypothetical protein
MQNPSCGSIIWTDVKSLPAVRALKQRLASEKPGDDSGRRLLAGALDQKGDHNTAATPCMIIGPGLVMGRRRLLDRLVVEAAPPTGRDISMETIFFRQGRFGSSIPAELGTRK